MLAAVSPVSARGATPVPEGKAFYKIGEAARIVGVAPYVLRYWETEFRFIRPDKSRTGQRVYAARDVETLRTIKKLLHEQGFTIAGARKRLRELQRGEPGAPAAAAASAGPDGGAADGAAAAELLESGRQLVRSRKLVARVRKEVEDLLQIVEADES